MRARAREVADRTGLDVPLEHGPWRAGDLERSVLDATQMRARVGEPLGLDEGLRATAAWWRGRPGR